MAEKKILKQLIHSLFNYGTPPTIYITWRDAIIGADNIEREVHDATSHNTTTTSSSKDTTTSSACNKNHSKSGKNLKNQDKKKPFFFYCPQCGCATCDSGHLRLSSQFHI
jgi:hypothetical protein